MNAGCASLCFIIRLKGIVTFTVSLVLIVTINGEFGVDQHTGVVTAKFYHIFQHQEEVSFIIFLVARIAGIFFFFPLCLLLGIWYWPLTLVENVHAPDAFQKPEEYSVLELLLKLSEGEYLARKVERAGTQDKSGVVELENNLQ